MSGREDAIDNSLVKYPSIDELLGGIIKDRARSADGGGFVIDNLLTPVTAANDSLEQAIAGYLVAVTSRPDAVRKSRDECGGTVSASRDIFDGRMLDLFAEIFVVDKLSREGFSQFQPIPRDNKPTPDYECVFVDDEGKQQGACLEIKNCRAPVGIMEVLKRELRDAAKARPWLNYVRWTMKHYWDNTATPHEIEEIKRIVASLQKDQFPVTKSFRLSSVETELEPERTSSVQIEFSRSGVGSSVLFRSLGGAYPIGPFTDPSKLAGKLRSTIQDGLLQLQSCRHVKRFLAVNINTPMHMLSEEELETAKYLVNDLAGGSVVGLFFLGFQSLIGSTL